MNNPHAPLDGPFDRVGRYKQDRINGFSEETIDLMLDAAEMDAARSVLDAMGGDGNLLKRLEEYCRTRSLALPERRVVVEYSRVQCEFAKVALAGSGAEVVWGDMLSLTKRKTGEPVTEHRFDRILIKSANHEIPEERQRCLYSNIYELLVPGGVFVNLGFLFDDAAERDEFRKIANAKDSLAGLDDLVKNRYFLLRSEFYGMVREAGFERIEPFRDIEYSINSRIVSDHYFAGDRQEERHFQFQASQALSRTMRRRRRIAFYEDRTLMTVPGEITVARKSSAHASSRSIYRRYPYEFLRSIEAHSALLDAAVQWVAPGDRVVDLGCGSGLLAERLREKGVRYTGIDLSKEFITRCREKFRGVESIRFSEGDLNRVELQEGAFDVAFLLNVLYQESIQPLAVLNRARGGLRAGGAIVVSGPLSPDSFRKAELAIEHQLCRDGLLPEHEEVFREIRAANEHLLSRFGNYWSAEGMAELLLRAGFREIRLLDTSLYYGNAYLVAALA